MDVDVSADRIGRSDAGFNPLRWFKRRFGSRLKLGWYTKAVNIGLHRALTDIDRLPNPPFSLSLQRLTPALRDLVLPLDTSEFADAEKATISDRRRLLELLPDNAYAVVDERNGEPCYVMWILGYEDRETIAKLEGFPPLQRHQFYAEGAYVPPKYRGCGVMTPAALMVLAKACENGATEAVSFIGEDNVPSLKGALRAGFEPYRRHVRHHFAFGLVQIERFAAFGPQHRLKLT